MLGQGNPEHRTVSEAVARAYVLRTYCRRFAGRGWVYADGALSIKAQEWLARGARCATGTEGGGIHEVPCKVVEDGVLDCGMLHFVRRSEARSYVERLERRQPVSCDDGTSLEALGIP
jgi:hypothetical protein